MSCDPEFMILISVQKMWPLLGSPDLSYSSTNTAQWNQRSYFLNSFHHKFMIPAFPDYSLEPKTQNLGTSCIRRQSRKKCDCYIYSAHRIWVTQAQIPWNQWGLLSQFFSHTMIPDFHDCSLEPKITLHLLSLPDFLEILLSKSSNGGEFMKFRPERKSWNSRDHKLWNNKMQGSPV